jgi:hypothetical protein
MKRLQYDLDYLSYSCWDHWIFIWHWSNFQSIYTKIWEGLQ